MAKYHLIANSDTTAFLSPMGFISSQAHALQFSTRQDALQHLQDNPLMRDRHGAQVVPVEVDEVIGRFAGQARTDYDPYGLNRVR